MASRKSKRKRLTIVIVVVVILVVVGVVLSHSSCRRSTLLSQKAPNFTLPTMAGANITLSELEGTPVVLNFWASFCNPCRTELPYLEAVAQESEGEVEVIAMNVGESASTVQTFFGDYEPTMIVALDVSGETFVDYCQEDNPQWYIPITFFIDSEGIVQDIKIGAFLTEAELWDTLNDVFGTTIP